MRHEIAARIAQIRRGEVPDGYKRAKAGIIPADWKISRFGDVFQFVPNNTYSRAFMTDSGGEIRNAHYGDVLIKYHSIIDCGAKDLPFLTPDAKISPAMFLKSGDIIIADTAEDFTAGKAVEMINVENEKVVSGLHTMACRPIKNLFAPKWLGYYMDSGAFHNQLIPLIRGAKVSSVTKAEIVNTAIAFPSLDEQRAIADVLSAQDRVIALKERLIAEKTRQKRYLAQQYLTGKRRLPGFHGEWKTVSLCDMAAYCNTRATGERKSYVSTETLRAHYGGILFSGESGEPVSGIAYQKGDVLVGNIRPYLQKVWRADRDGVCDSDVLVLRSFQVEPSYFYFLIARDAFFEYVMRNAKGSKMPRGDKAHIMSMSIDIPASAEEQRAIAELLSAADKEIELLRRSLELERRKKQALAQLLLTGLVRPPQVPALTPP